MRATIRFGWVMGVLAVSAVSLATHSDARPRARAAAGNIYARVILYDAFPGQEEALQRELTAAISPADVRRLGIINDRVLKNIDPIAAQFATYTKFSNTSGAEQFLIARLDRVRNLVRRAPEEHLVLLESSYTPTRVQNRPTGQEFGYKEVGQTASLFFGLPDPNYGQEYFDALVEVKTLSVRRAPPGWLGDDLLSSNTARQPEKLAPYTPRPAISTTISIAYAEYTSFENAEDAYLNRQNSDDPSLIQLQRVFFGALQVPTRFFIFKVVANR